MQERVRHGMLRHAHADQRTPGGYRIRNGSAARQQQRQWTGPEGVHKSCRIFGHMRRD